jgi:holo-[acyl-carrier protein] synthase
MIVGLGVDLFDVTRMRAEVSRHGFDLTHLFAPAELAQCLGLPRAARELALRFAAKEAVVKALGADDGVGPNWPDIEILEDPARGRYARLRGPLGARADRQGITRIHLSTTHAAGVVIASAVLEATS